MTYFEKAVERFEAGFTSKASVKEALDYVNRAFEVSTGEIRELHLRGERTAASHDLYWALPMYPHQWKPKHAEHVLSVFPDAQPTLDTINDVVALRNAIKAAPIHKVERSVSEFEAKTTERVTKTLKEIMELRQTQFARGLRLQEIFGDLPVYANTHWVVNQHGTGFIRTFFYLGSKLTPLNVIIAVLQEKEAA